MVNTTALYDDKRQFGCCVLIERRSRMVPVVEVRRVGSTEHLVLPYTYTTCCCQGIAATDDDDETRIDSPFPRFTCSRCRSTGYVSSCSYGRRTTAAENATTADAAFATLQCHRSRLSIETLTEVAPPDPLYQLFRYPSI